MVCGRRSLPTRESQSIIDHRSSIVHASTVRQRPSTATHDFFLKTIYSLSAYVGQPHTRQVILNPESRDIILMRLDSLKHGSHGGVLTPFTTFTELDKAVIHPTTKSSVDR
jgi:hypothetical protein